MSEDTLDDILIDNNNQFNNVEFAGFWIRVGAAFIDFFVLIPIMVLSFYNLFNMKSVVLLYVLTLMSSLYKPLLEWRYGATLGKMACKIRVVNEEMKFISIDQAFGRYIPWAISVIITLISSTSMYLSANFKNITTYEELNTISQESSLNTISSIYSIVFLIIVGSLIFDMRKQGIHDKIAKTFCIKVKKVRDLT